MVCILAAYFLAGKVLEDEICCVSEHFYQSRSRKVIFSLVCVILFSQGVGTQPPPCPDW